MNNVSIYSSELPHKAPSWKFIIKIISQSADDRKQALQAKYVISISASREIPYESILILIWNTQIMNNICTEVNTEVLFHPEWGRLYNSSNNNFKRFKKSDQKIRVNMNICQGKEHIGTW